MESKGRSGAWVSVLGVVLTVIALVALGFGVRNLQEHEFVGAILLTVVGLSMLSGAMSLLRSTMGE